MILPLMEYGEVIFNFEEAPQNKGTRLILGLSDQSFSTTALTELAKKTLVTLGKIFSALSLWSNVRITYSCNQFQAG